MDLNLVSQILKKIILERGKVSLPMMGSLETEDVPAGFAKGGSIITPPHRKIVFNSFELTNDGLLESEYAAASGITLEDSKKEVAEFINSIKTSLIDESDFLIPGLGKIIFGEDFRYGFDEEGSLNLSPDSFGLDSFEVEKNNDNVAEPVPETEQEEEPRFAKESRDHVDYDFGPEEDSELHIDARKTSSVADVYKIAPVAMAPAVKNTDGTIKGTVIVDSGRTENQETVAEEVHHAVKKNAEILHFSKRQNPVDNKSGNTDEMSGEKREKFIPSVGILGGHAYIFGKPLQSEATEVVVLGDNGKFEVEHAAIELEEIAAKRKSGTAKTGSVELAQSAIGAIGIKEQSENVSDVEVNVVTKALASDGIELPLEETKLSADEIELKKKLEAQEIAESEKKAEEKLWKDAQRVQMQKQKEEEARAEAERIESEKKKAEEIAARRRQGKFIEEDKTERGFDGQPRTKVVKDIEGQDESAKESIAEIFTTVAEKEANAAGAKVVGEKEAAKDWNTVKTAAVQEDEPADKIESPADKIESHSDEALQKDEALQNIEVQKMQEAQEAQEAEEMKAKSKAKAEAWAMWKKREEAKVRAERKLRNARVLKYLKYFGYGVAAVVVLALIIYALREPLRPVLEHLLYNADELSVIQYKL